MDHPSMSRFARYALGDITDDAELAAFEDHLLECEQCRRQAMAVDLIGTAEAESNDKVMLHIAAGPDGMASALCGDTASRNIISELLLPGIDAAVVCPQCLAMLRTGGRNDRRVN